MKKDVRLIGLIAVITLGLGMPHAFAGDNQPPEQKPADETMSPTMDAATIDKFVDVYADVQMIQQKYTQKLQTATSKEAARNLQEQAQVEMVEAVQANGITVEEYNEMIQVVSSNPELMEEIEKKMEN